MGRNPSPFVLELRGRGGSEIEGNADVSERIPVPWDRARGPWCLLCPVPAALGEPSRKAPVPELRERRDLQALGFNCFFLPHITNDPSQA